MFASQATYGGFDPATYQARGNQLYPGTIVQLYDEVPPRYDIKYDDGDFEGGVLVRSSTVRTPCTYMHIDTHSRTHARTHALTYSHRQYTNKPAASASRSPVNLLSRWFVLLYVTGSADLLGVDNSAANEHGTQREPVHFSGTLAPTRRRCSRHAVASRERLSTPP